MHDEQTITLFSSEEYLSLRDISLQSDDEDDDEGADPFVDNLICQLEDLHGKVKQKQRVNNYPLNAKPKWIEAETRCATIESTIRQQVAKEMESELRQMEDIYMSALKDKVLKSEKRKG